MGEEHQVGKKKLNNDPEMSWKRLVDSNIESMLPANATYQQLSHSESNDLTRQGFKYGGRCSLKSRENLERIETTKLRETATGDIVETCTSMHQHTSFADLANTKIIHKVPMPNKLNDLEDFDRKPADIETPTMLPIFGEEDPNSYNKECIKTCAATSHNDTDSNSRDQSLLAAVCVSHDMCGKISSSCENLHDPPIKGYNDELRIMSTSEDLHETRSMPLNFDCELYQTPVAGASGKKSSACGEKITLDFDNSSESHPALLSVSPESKHWTLLTINSIASAEVNKEADQNDTGETDQYSMVSNPLPDGLCLPKCIDNDKRKDEIVDQDSESDESSADSSQWVDTESRFASSEEWDSASSDSNCSFENDNSGTAKNSTPFESRTLDENKMNVDISNIMQQKELLALQNEMNNEGTVHPLKSNQCSKTQVESTSDRRSPYQVSQHENSRQFPCGNTEEQSGCKLSPTEKFVVLLNRRLQENSKMCETKCLHSDWDDFNVKSNAQNTAIMSITTDITTDKPSLELTEIPLTQWRQFGDFNMDSMLKDGEENHTRTRSHENQKDEDHVFSLIDRKGQDLEENDLLAGCKMQLREPQFYDHDEEEGSDCEGDMTLGIDARETLQGANATSISRSQVSITPEGQNVNIPKVDVSGNSSNKDVENSDQTQKGKVLSFLVPQADDVLESCNDSPLIREGYCGACSFSAAVNPINQISEGPSDLSKAQMLKIDIDKGFNSDPAHHPFRLRGNTGNPDIESATRESDTVDKSVKTAKSEQCGPLVTHWSNPDTCSDTKGEFEQGVGSATFFNHEGIELYRNSKKEKVDIFYPETCIIHEQDGPKFHECQGRGTTLPSIKHARKNITYDDLKGIEKEEGSLNNVLAMGRERMTSDTGQSSVLAGNKNLVQSPSTPWKRLMETNIDSMLYSNYSESIVTNDTVDGEFPNETENHEGQWFGSNNINDVYPRIKKISSVCGTASKSSDLFETSQGKERYNDQPPVETNASSTKLVSGSIADPSLSICYFRDNNGRGFDSDRNRCLDSQGFERNRVILLHKEKPHEIFSPCLNVDDKGFQAQTDSIPEEATLKEKRDLLSDCNDDMCLLKHFTKTSTSRHGDLNANIYTCDTEKMDCVSASQSSPRMCIGRYTGASDGVYRSDHDMSLSLKSPSEHTHKDCECDSFCEKGIVEALCLFVENSQEGCVVPEISSYKALPANASVLNYDEDNRALKRRGAKTASINCEWNSIDDKTKGAHIVKDREKILALRSESDPYQKSNLKEVIDVVGISNQCCGVREEIPFGMERCGDGSPPGVSLQLLFSEEFLTEDSLELSKFTSPPAPKIKPSESQDNSGKSEITRCRKLDGDDPATICSFPPFVTPFNFEEVSTAPNLTLQLNKDPLTHWKGTMDSNIKPESTDDECDTFKRNNICSCTDKQHYTMQTKVYDNHGNLSGISLSAPIARNSINEQAGDFAPSDQNLQVFQKYSDSDAHASGPVTHLQKVSCGDLQVFDSCKPMKRGNTFVEMGEKQNDKINLESCHKVQESRSATALIETLRTVQSKGLEQLQCIASDNTVSMDIPPVSKTRLLEGLYSRDATMPIIKKDFNMQSESQSSGTVKTENKTFAHASTTIDVPILSTDVPQDKESSLAILNSSVPTELYKEICEKITDLGESGESEMNRDAEFNSESAQHLVMVGENKSYSIIESVSSKEDTASKNALTVEEELRSATNKHSFSSHLEYELRDATCFSKCSLQHVTGSFEEEQREGDSLIHGYEIVANENEDCEKQEGDNSDLNKPDTVCREDGSIASREAFGYDNGFIKGSGELDSINGEENGYEMRAKLEARSTNKPIGTNELTNIKDLLHSPTTPWKRLMETNIDSMLNTRSGASLIGHGIIINKTEIDDAPCKEFSNPSNALFSADVTFSSVNTCYERGDSRRTSRECVRGQENLDQQSMGTSNQVDSGFGDESSTAKITSVHEDSLKTLSVDHNSSLLTKSCQAGLGISSASEQLHKARIWSLKVDSELCESSVGSLSQKTTLDEVRSVLDFDMSSLCQSESLANPLYSKPLTLHATDSASDTTGSRLSSGSSGKNVNVDHPGTNNVETSDTPTDSLVCVGHVDNGYSSDFSNGDNDRCFDSNSDSHANYMRFDTSEQNPIDTWNFYKVLSEMILVKSPVSLNVAGLNHEMTMNERIGPDITELDSSQSLEKASSFPEISLSYLFCGTSPTQSDVKNGRSPTQSGYKDSKSPILTGDKDGRSPTQSGDKDGRSPTQSGDKDGRSPTQSGDKDGTSPTLSADKDRTSSTQSGDKDLTSSTQSGDKDGMSPTQSGDKNGMSPTQSGDKDLSEILVLPTSETTTTITTGGLKVNTRQRFLSESPRFYLDQICVLPMNTETWNSGTKTTASQPALQLTKNPLIEWKRLVDSNIDSMLISDTNNQYLSKTCESSKQQGNESVIMEHNMQLIENFRKSSSENNQREMISEESLEDLRDMKTDEIHTETSLKVLRNTSLEYVYDAQQNVTESGKLLDHDLSESQSPKPPDPEKDIVSTAVLGDSKTASYTFCTLKSESDNFESTSPASEMCRLGKDTQLTKGLDSESQVLHRVSAIEESKPKIKSDNSKSARDNGFLTVDKENDDFLLISPSTATDSPLMQEESPCTLSILSSVSEKHKDFTDPSENDEWDTCSDVDFDSDSDCCPLRSSGSFRSSDIYPALEDPIKTMKTVKTGTDELCGPNVKELSSTTKCQPEGTICEAFSLVDGTNESHDSKKKDDCHIGNNMYGTTGLEDLSGQEVYNKSVTLHSIRSGADQDMFDSNSRLLELQHRGLEPENIIYDSFNQVEGETEQCPNIRLDTYKASPRGTRRISLLQSVKHLEKNPTTQWKRLMETNIDTMLNICRDSLPTNKGITTQFSAGIIESHNEEAVELASSNKADINVNDSLQRHNASDDGDGERKPTSRGKDSAYTLAMISAGSTSADAEMHRSRTGKEGMLTCVKSEWSDGIFLDVIEKERDWISSKGDDCKEVPNKHIYSSRFDTIEELDALSAHTKDYTLWLDTLTSEKSSGNGNVAERTHSPFPKQNSKDFHKEKGYEEEIDKFEITDRSKSISLKENIKEQVGSIHRHCAQNDSPSSNENPFQSIDTHFPDNDLHGKECSTSDDQTHRLFPTSVKINQMISRQLPNCSLLVANYPSNRKTNAQSEQEEDDGWSLFVQSYDEKSFVQNVPDQREDDIYKPIPALDYHSKERALSTLKINVSIDNSRTITATTVHTENVTGSSENLIPGSDFRYLSIKTHSSGQEGQLEAAEPLSQQLSQIENGFHVSHLEPKEARNDISTNMCRDSFRGNVANESSLESSKGRLEASEKRINLPAKIAKSVSRDLDEEANFGHLVICSLLDVVDSYHHVNSIIILPPAPEEIKGTCASYQLKETENDREIISSVDLCDDYNESPYKQGIVGQGLVALSKIVKHFFGVSTAQPNNQESQKQTSIRFREPPDVRSLRDRDGLDTYVIESEDSAPERVMRGAVRAARRRQRRRNAKRKQRMSASMNKGQDEEHYVEAVEDCRSGHEREYKASKKHMISIYEVDRCTGERQGAIERFDIQTQTGDSDIDFECKESRYDDGTVKIKGDTRFSSLPERQRHVELVVNTKTTPNDHTLSEFFRTSEQGEELTAIPHDPDSREVVKLKDLIETRGNFKVDYQRNVLKREFSGTSQSQETRSIGWPESVADSMEEETDEETETSGTDVESSDSLRYSVECLLEVIVQRGKPYLKLYLG